LSAEASINDEIFSSINFGPTDESLTVEQVAKIAVETWGDSAAYEVINENSDLESKTLDLDSSFARSKLEWEPIWNQKESVKRAVSWWKDIFDKKVSILEATESDLEELMKIMSGNK
jgi:CDP-glucose 4,6-dehydratase